MTGRTWLVFLGLAAVGCGAPPPAPPARATPRVKRVRRPPAAAIALPPPPPVQPLHEVCRAPTPGAVKYPRRAAARILDFAPLSIDATGHGPRVERQPRDGFVRSAASIRAAVSRQYDRLALCLRAARGFRISTGDGGHVRVSVAMTIDPFGLPADIAVTGQSPSLDDCIAESLAAIEVSRRTPRATHVTGDIVFRDVSDARARSRLRRPPPRPPVAESPVGCLHTLDPTPVDTLEIEVLQEIDFAPDATTPSMGPGTCAVPEIGKGMVRSAVVANAGAYSDCYAAALVRQPGLTGTVTAHLVFGLSGEPSPVTVDGDGDDALHACMRDALSAIVLTSTTMAVTATIPFALQPDPPDAAVPASTDPGTLADAALAAGELDEAAARYAGLAGDAPGDDEACRARIGIIDAYAAVPWVVDARVMASVRALADFIQGHDRAALAGCITDAAPALERLGRWPIPTRATDYEPWRGGGLAEAVARTRTLIELFPELEVRLTPFVADGLATLEQPAAAVERYLRFLQLGVGDKDAIEWAAEGYHAAAYDLETGVSWGGCELTLL